MRKPLLVMERKVKYLIEGVKKGRRGIDEDPNNIDSVVKYMVYSAHDD